jgi:hypothetical protein
MNLKPFAVAGLLFASAVPAVAADSIYGDIGVLLGVRLYRTALMDHCYQQIDHDDYYLQARDMWLVRNADELGTLKAAIAKIGGLTDEQDKRMAGMVAGQIVADFAARSDPAAYCRDYAEKLNQGVNDYADLEGAQPSLKRVRAFVAGQ